MSMNFAVSLICYERVKCAQSIGTLTTLLAWTENFPSYLSKDPNKRKLIYLFLVMV